MDPKDEYIRRATAHHRGGAGRHADKRTRRRRTRQADRWAAFEDQTKRMED